MPPLRLLGLTGAVFLLSACAGDATTDSATTDSATTDSAATDSATTDSDCDPDGDADGDNVSDCDELDLGTDPTNADTDGDGSSDGEETDCGSDPLNGEEACYSCGWKRNDPGTLVSTGNEVGDVIANMTLVDQCGEEVELWDFAGEYHILWMTAAW